MPWRAFRALTVMVCVSITAGTAVAQVSPITTLYSTGVDDFGLPLAGFAPDTHYSLVASPVGNPPAAPGIVVDVLPPAWVANTATSQWINPDGVGALPADWHPGGTYTYETTFSLAGFIPTTASISLGWAADDNDPSGGAILLNGVPIVGATTGTSPGSYAGLHPALISGVGLPWLPGINTLTFVTTNTQIGPTPSGPTGLHVHIVTAEATLIPEPATLTLLLAGVLLIRGRGGKRFTESC